MAKKLIALLLAVLMVAGMLAGCAKTAETPAPATEDPADTTDSSSTTDTPAPSSGIKLAIVGIGDCSANKFVIEVFGKIGIICPVVFDAQQEILTDISLAILNI